MLFSQFCSSSALENVSADLAISILSKRSIADIIHTLSLTSIPAGHVLEIVQTSLKIVQDTRHFPPSKMMLEMVGAILAINRYVPKNLAERHSQRY